jgi:hypothetical protein
MPETGSTSCACAALRLVLPLVAPTQNDRFKSGQSNETPHLVALMEATKISTVRNGGR